MTSGVHGPAATMTAPAAISSPSIATRSTAPPGGAQRGHRTLDHVRAAGMRERCERPRRGPRSDREADVEVDRGQPRRQ